MNKHTPGPWEVLPAINYNGFAVAPSGTLPTLASVERCGHSVSVHVHNFPGETEPNARLIAAAPDLLAALEHMLGACDPTVDREDDEHFDYADAYIACDAARAAIARARGEA